MQYNRRSFIKNSGLFASAIALTGFKYAAPDEAKHRLSKFGLQLYTLRDDLPKDPKGILKQVASFGYKQVEGFEGKEGMFWGMSNKEFKNYLDEIGLTMVSSHCDTDKDFERKAAEASEIGMKYLLVPWIGPQKTNDDYKRFADKFNGWGETCRKNGIRFAYHNHDYSFRKSEGQYPQDIFMQNTDPGLVDYEMDIYWVVTAGEDPVEWLQRYPNRFRLCHVKDRAKDAPAAERDASVNLGTGSIDFKKILGVAKNKGMRYYILEQEKYDNTTPLESAQVGAEYLEHFSF